MKKILLLALLLAPLMSWSQNYFTEVDSARKWFDRGVQSFFNRGEEEIDYQIECYTTAIELDPNFKDAYRYRAAQYFRKEAYDKSIEDCNSYLELAQSDERKSKYIMAKVYYRRGECHVMKDELAEAMLDYEKAIELMPREDKYARAKKRVMDLIASRKGK